MSVTVKRKRGRPRLDEPKEIKDFDNNLIQSFKKFPVFYDRHHHQHRNREYTDRIWTRIAHSLNVSTNLVKTRMLQLRNRFNLEKRRVEALREQQSDPTLTSQWQLYERLEFLCDYVKTRRPYSLPIAYNPKASSSASSSENEEEEEEDEEEEEHDEDDEMTNLQEKPIDTNKILTNGKHLNHGKELPSNQNHLAAAIEVPQTVQQNLVLLGDGNHVFGNKYKAFGQFLASSLVEMNEIQALSLVEKFTTDIVKYLKMEESSKFTSNTSQRSNPATED